VKHGCRVVWVTGDRMQFCVSKDAVLKNEDAVLGRGEGLGDTRASFIGKYISLALFHR
jgi:hypothetical protein